MMVPANSIRTPPIFFLAVEIFFPLSPTTAQGNPISKPSNTPDLKPQ